MFTSTEKKYLALTLFFLATGTGIKAYRHAKVRIGPMEDPVFAALDSLPSQPKIDTAIASSTNLVDTVVRDSTKSGAAEHSQLSSRPLASSVHKSTFFGKVSLNQASATELTEISGIGVKTAETIVQYRKEHGPFRDLRELLQVKGIGEKKFEKIRPFLLL